jgi:aryl-alcohol dehydrogenase-like predicted oxidoreductase
MQHRRFGRLGWQVSEIGYGMWGMGGWTGSDDDESLRALDRAIELGCNFFDTALAYGDGKSEQLLGPSVRRHSGKKLYVATKIPPGNRKWPALDEYPLDAVYSADHIRRSTETSLENLGLPSIDLQQFHVWTDKWAADDRWQRAVADLKSQGLVKGIGISVNRWQPVNVLKALRTGLIDSVQVVYNIFDQDPEEELLPVCRELGIAVIARVPFDEGSLTGTITAETTFPEGDWRNLYFSPDKLPAILERVDRIRADVPAGMTLPDLALRFILANPDASTVIPGMRRPRHVEANLAASDGKALPSELLKRLRRHAWNRSYFVP